MGIGPYAQGGAFAPKVSPCVGRGALIAPSPPQRLAPLKGELSWPTAMTEGLFSCRRHTYYIIHYSLFTIHYSLFTIHYSLFTIHYSLRIGRRLV